MAKKKENILEKVTEEMQELVEATPKVIEEVVEKIEEVVENVVSEKKPSKKISDKDSDSKKSKLEELKAKAKALESKIQEEKKVDVKGEVKGEKEDKKDMLVPIEDYLKSSIHLGTRVITPDMKSFVYKRRADGLAVFNTNVLDDKLREAGDYLAQYSPEEIVVVCKREAGWKAAKLFGELFNIRTFTKKYPAGSLTNPNLADFFEANLVLICDPWLDKNALKDANDIKINVMAVCDTNNFTQGIDFITPGNNKSAKSLGMVFYLLTKLYSEKRKIKLDIPPIEEFIEEWATAEIPA